MVKDETRTRRWVTQTLYHSVDLEYQGGTLRRGYHPSACGEWGRKFNHGHSSPLSDARPAPSDNRNRLLTIKRVPCMRQEKNFPHEVASEPPRINETAPRNRLTGEYPNQRRRREPPPRAIWAIRGFQSWWQGWNGGQDSIRQNSTVRIGATPQPRFGAGASR